MGNERNLKHDFSPEEARENGRKGGIASAKARAKLKSQREFAQMVLSLPLKNDTVEDIQSLADAQKKNIPAGLAALIALMKKAINGDGKAYEIVRDTAGEKPTDRLEMTEAPDIAQAAEEIAAMIDEFQAEEEQEEKERELMMRAIDGDADALESYRKLQADHSDGEGYTGKRLGTDGEGYSGIAS